MSLVEVYLGLGSNTERTKHLCAGLDALQALFGQLECSPVFESEAVGIRSACFFNMVVRIKTSMPLLELVRHLKRIERLNGRFATTHQSLSLDIDILLYGQQTGVFGGICLPRAEVLKNAFVLWPLAILAPEVLHPLAQRSFFELWQEAQIEQKLWPVNFHWQGQQLTPQNMVKSSVV